MRRILTDEERDARRKARVAAVLNQRRPYAVPTADEWVDEFRRRFGNGDAMGLVGGRAEAFAYFGLDAETATATRIKTAFRRKIFDVHPDRGGSEEEARRCLCYYNVLSGG